MSDHENTSSPAKAKLAIERAFKSLDDVHSALGHFEFEQYEQSTGDKRVVLETQGKTGIPPFNEDGGIAVVEDAFEQAVENAERRWDGIRELLCFSFPKLGPFDCDGGTYAFGYEAFLQMAADADSFDAFTDSVELHLEQRLFVERCQLLRDHVGASNLLFDDDEATGVGAKSEVAPLNSEDAKLQSALKMQIDGAKWSEVAAFYLGKNKPSDIETGRIQKRVIRYADTTGQTRRIGRPGRKPKE